MILRRSFSEKNLTVPHPRSFTLETESIGAVDVSQESSASSVTGCEAENGFISTPSPTPQKNENFSLFQRI